MTICKLDSSALNAQPEFCKAGKKLWDSATNDDDRTCSTPCTDCARSDASLKRVEDSTSDSDRASSPRELSEVLDQQVEEVEEVPQPRSSIEACAAAQAMSPHGKLTRMSDIPYTMVKGIKYPAFFKESAVLELQETFTPRAGDVFLVSGCPIVGLQRVLVALVEGRDDPWAPDLLDKAYFVDAGASRRGTPQWMELADSWETNSGRRCFKTHSLPATFPSRYPFEAEPAEGKPAPKIIVLAADPRNYLTTFWTMARFCMGLEETYTDFIEDYLVRGGGMGDPASIMLGSWIQHMVSWSEEAEKNPEQIKMVSMDRLGSLDPKEFASELAEVANFIGVSEDAVQRLTQGVFRRPNLVPPPDSELASMDFGRRWLFQAFESGHLVEQSAKNSYTFEDALSQMSGDSLARWADMLSMATRYAGNPVVTQLAQIASKGVLSLPPVAMTQVAKGEAAHNAGTCKPCVFALRGICKDGDELCRFCHDASHPRTKRASRSKRTAKKALMRLRTPSPDPLDRQLASSSDEWR